MKTIDLAYPKIEEITQHPEPLKEDEPRYPTVYISEGGKDLEKLPSGRFRAVVEMEVKSLTRREDMKKDKVEISADLCLYSITPEESSEKPVNKMTDRKSQSDQLDKTIDEAISKDSKK